MLLKIIKSNSLLSLVLPVLFVIAIWCSAYFIHGPIYQESHVSMFDTLFGWLIKIPFPAFIVALGLLILEAYTWNAFISKQMLLKQTTYLPALFYFFLCSCRPVLISFYPAIAASLFLILALKRLAESYKKEKALSESFDAGVLIGIASLLYYPVALFVIFLWIALIIMRSLVWREWVASLIGFLLPFAFMLGYYSVFYSPAYFLYNKLPVAIGGYRIMSTFNWNQVTLIAILGIIALLSLFVFISKFSDNVVKNQKLSSLIIWYACVAGASVIISPERDARALVLLALPFSFIFSRYFVRVKLKWIHDVLFILLIIAIVINIFF